MALEALSRTVFRQKGWETDGLEAGGCGHGSSGSHC